MPSPSLSLNEKACRTRGCGRTLAWHPVAQVFVHVELGHVWCFPDRSGYDQPRATA